MGNGIAQVAAAAGLSVIMSDIKPEFCDKGMATITKNLDRMVKKEKISEADKSVILERISTTTDLNDMAKVDFVVEAAVEREDLKFNIFKDLDRICPDHVILSTNTSSIPIGRIAAQTSRPEKVIGMHFMNPVPLMKLVEIIRGLATDQETYEMATALAGRLGKTTTNAEDYPAFIVNRILVPMINEAVYALYEGVGTVESIDTAMRLGANHPMGPLTLADFIGLDTCLSIMQVLHDGLADTKYRPCPLLVKYVEAGWVGRKAGRGFYDYSGEAPVPTR
jgi:3-hydroxybutyryl-CoA dehydrogenase